MSCQKSWQLDRDYEAKPLGQEMKLDWGVELVECFYFGKGVLYLFWQMFDKKALGFWRVKGCITPVFGWSVTGNQFFFFAETGMVEHKFNFLIKYITFKKWLKRRFFCKQATKRNTNKNTAQEVHVDFFSAWLASLLNSQVKIKEQKVMECRRNCVSSYMIYK